MKLFISYIKYHGKSVGIIAVAAAVLCVIFVLYSLPQEPLYYSVALCTVFSLPIVIADYRAFRRRHTEMQELLSAIVNDIDLLPEPANLPQADYNALAQELFAGKCAAESEKSLAITEMSDYYTLWAHQIKTPIAAMRLILQAMPAGENTAELEEQLFRIEEYVEMVLTYIRSDENGADYVIRLTPLDGIIKEAVKKYRKSFIRKRIALEYEETDISVVTDEKWLSFVIGQILSNSLKYTPPGGKISICVPTRNSLTIRDSGIGIASEDLPRVFEKGYTGYNGRADKKSTGIGLYLSKRVLTGLSHSVEIDSTVGEGTAVTIRFPEGGRVYE